MKAYGLNHALVRVTGGLWAAVPIVKAIRKQRRKQRVLKIVREHMATGVQYHDTQSAADLDANR